MDKLFRARLKSLPKSSQRIYSILRKRTWKHSEEIKQVAGVHLTEGLRRMRELRSIGLKIETRRVPGSYQYEYRLAGAQKST